MPKAPSVTGSAEHTWKMSQESTAAVCSTCGRIEHDEAAVPLSWARGLEKGREIWTCDLCCREHLRAIESKLDYTWW